MLSLNAVFAADVLLVPVSADFLSLQGAEQVERALNALEHGAASAAYNLGTGRGTSVAEVVAADVGAVEGEPPVGPLVADLAAHHVRREVVLGVVDGEPADEDDATEIIQCHSASQQVADGDIPRLKTR